MTVKYYEPKGYVDESKPRCSTVIPNIATEPVSVIRCPSQERVETIAVQLDTMGYAVLNFCQSCRESYRIKHDMSLGVISGVSV